MQLFLCSIVRQKHSDTYRVPVMFVVSCFCKHSNCADFARTVPVFDMLSQCPGLNSSTVLDHTFIMNCIYSNSYLQCYKKHNSSELSKNVVSKTFDLNVRVLFQRHTFDSIINSGKLIQKLSSEVFFENIKTESNSRFLSIISEFINGNENEETVFFYYFWKKTNKI